MRSPACSTVGRGILPYHLSCSGGHFFPFLGNQLLANPVNTLNMLIIDGNNMALSLINDLSTSDIQVGKHIIRQ